MIPFWKIIPGGNPTILVHEKDVPPEKRSAVSNALMSPFSAHAEQVGFVDHAERRITMMGGEFCVNAVRAFAVLLAEEDMRNNAGKNCYMGHVLCSGAEDPVQIRVEPRGNGMYYSQACLLFKDLPVPHSLGGGAHLVRVPGISHVIEATGFPESPALYCSAQRKANGLDEECAVGHLWLSPCADPSGMDCDCSLTPLVWVRGTATLCPETACGSGTLAAALHLRRQTGKNSFRIMQPSGYALDVSFERCARGWEAWIGGMAWIAVRGTAALPASSLT